MRVWALSGWLLAVALGGAMPRAGRADDVVDLVVGLLQENDKEIRALGLEQVRSEAKGEAATKQFAAQLPKLSPDGQIGLLSALADRGDVAARPGVREVLAASKDEAVRTAAISALGFLGEPADAARLTAALAKGSKKEQAAAKGALVRLRGDGAPAAIVAEMKSAAPQVRVTLIDVLATRRALATIPDVLALAVDAEPIVRAAAMSALAQMATAEHLPGMAQGVLKAERGAERTAAERAIAAVCARITPESERAAPLIAILDKVADDDRAVLLPALGRVGGPAALKVIEATIAASDPKTHEIGVRALCNWPDASTAARLIELAKSDSRPELRMMALAALIRVAPLPDKRTDDERLELVKKVLAMCQTDAERKLVLQRAKAIRTIATLRFVAPYMDQPAFAPAACETVVELAHHRALRDANKAEFHKALDKVLATTKDATLIERANRYKRGQTWAKPMATE